MGYLAATCGLLLAGYFGWTLTSRSAYETAAYEVLESDGPFEVRDYASLVMATTEMRFDAQQNDGSFNRLFSYISGSNAESQKVAMTTPVFMNAESAGKRGQMGFVVPASVVADGVPEPSDAQVELRSREGGRFAAIRFSGRLNTATRRDAEQRLRSWMSEHKHSPNGDAEAAGYDPPWTPGPFRRNEVLIRIQ